MRKPTIDLSFATNTLAAMNHYTNSLPMIAFGGNSPEFKAKLTALGFDPYKPETHYQWHTPEMHIYPHTWGSTSGGWGGVGGAAMSTYYTTIFINPVLNFGVVYWNGRPAYVFALDEKSEKMRDQGWTGFPSIDDAPRKLTILTFLSRNL